MKEIKTKLIGKHHKDCYAIKNYNEGTWDTPWAYFTEEKTYGTRVSVLQKNRSSAWIYVRCNDSKCKAKLAVLEDDLLVLLAPKRKR